MPGPDAPRQAITEHAARKLPTLSIGPAVRSYGRNFLIEVIGRFTPVSGVFAIVIGGGEVFGRLRRSPRRGSRSPRSSTFLLFKTMAEQRGCD